MAKTTPDTTTAETAAATRPAWAHKPSRCRTPKASWLMANAGSQGLRHGTKVATEELRTALTSPR